MYFDTVGHLHFEEKILITETLGRSKKYLAWIRRQECLVTQSHHNIIAHHITIKSTRGISQKPSDYWCIPLTNEQHVSLHHMGERAYWQYIGVDNIHALAVELLMRYMYTQCSADEINGLDVLRCLNEFAAARHL